MSAEDPPKIALSFTEISCRLHALNLPPVEIVVGIGTGGTVPAAILAHQLSVPLLMFFINYRAPDNQPQRPMPELLLPPQLPHVGSRVLLVDDVSVTGSTLELAAAQLSNCDVTTLVLKGKADFVVFPDVPQCVYWPWKPD